MAKQKEKKKSDIIKELLEEAMEEAEKVKAEKIVEEDKGKTKKTRNSELKQEIVESEKEEIFEEGQEEVKEVEEEQAETKSLVKKDEIVIKQEALEKIEEEIKKQKTIPNSRIKKINGRLFKNVLIAICIVLYFIFIMLGYYNIEQELFLTDLKVFSLTAIGITIIIFEYAYKKDSGENAIFGIEILALSIFTLMLDNVYRMYNDKFIYIVNSVSMLFAIYYIGKCIIIYKKMRKKALKKANDIHKIAKK